HDATCTEAVVERAIAVVTCQREPVTSDDIGLSGHDDVPVRLDGNGKRPVIAASEIRDHFAACAEAGVERAIALVARKRDVEDSVNVGLSRDDDLPVQLDGKRIPERIGEALLEVPEISDHLTASPERGVERAVVVVAHQREVLFSLDVGDARYDNLS